MDLTVRECAFNHHYKLYRDGSFFDLRQDPFEASPVDPASLGADQISAQEELQSALARYADVRPAALDEAFAKTPRELKPSKAKKNAPR